MQNQKQKQTKNSTQSTEPKAGDGTQDVRKNQDANWYGQSEEPQEEFTNDSIGVGGDSRRHGPVSAVDPHPARTSEGSLVDADSGHDLLTPERAVERDPKRPTDVPTTIDNRH